MDKLHNIITEVDFSLKKLLLEEYMELYNNLLYFNLFLFLEKIIQIQ